MSGSDSTLRLIELASATLCRDISGLGGTLDRRLALQRAAWGPVTEPLSLARLRWLAHGLPDNVMTDASGLDQGTVFDATAGRIVLNLLLLAADGLPHGGVVTLAGSADDLFIRIAGPGAAWPTGTAACVANEVEARAALSAWRHPQMALTALLAHAAGIRLSVLLSPAAQNDPALLRLGG